jgi:hypothetical protein
MNGGKISSVSADNAAAIFRVCICTYLQCQFFFVFFFCFFFFSSSKPFMSVVPVTDQSLPRISQTAVCQARTSSTQDLPFAHNFSDRCILLHESTVSAHKSTGCNPTQIYFPSFHIGTVVGTCDTILRFASHVIQLHFVKKQAARELTAAAVSLTFNLI